MHVDKILERKENNVQVMTPCSSLRNLGTDGYTRRQLLEPARLKISLMV